MSPFLAIADLTDGTFAVVAIDPTRRVGDGCAAIVQSLHHTRDGAVSAIEGPLPLPNPSNEGGARG